jgi:hypothetical protein
MGFGLIGLGSHREIVFGVISIEEGLGLVYGPDLISAIYVPF